MNRILTANAIHSISARQSNSREVFLGVDPGLGTTGYGVIERLKSGLKVREAGVIRTSRRAPLERRLAQIFDGLTEVINEHSPSSVVIEDLYSHYKHPRTAIVMAHARGAVCLSAAAAKLPVITYGATRIKKSLTGNGRASKTQVQKMIQLRLGLAEIPQPPDVADALAVALCHVSHSRQQR